VNEFPWLSGWLSCVILFLFDYRPFAFVTIAGLLSKKVGL